jgi:hypothetical protein
MNGARDEDAADRSLCLETSCDVHAIAIEIVCLDDQIPRWIPTRNTMRLSSLSPPFMSAIAC